MSRDRAVIDYRWCDRTCTDTSCCEQGELFVWRRFPSFDLCEVFDPGQHLIAAFDVARGTKADDASVRTLRLQREKVVECRDAINSAQRNMQRRGDKLQGVLVKLAERFLDGV